MKVKLFGRDVTLYPRKAKHWLQGQELYRELIKGSAEIRYLSQQQTTKENELKVIEFSREYELNDFSFRITLLSNSLKQGIVWWKFWNLNLYRKFRESYLLHKVNIKELKKYTDKILSLEGGSENGEPLEDFIPLDEGRVKAFVHKHAGIPYDKITEMTVTDFFDSIQLAGEMLRIQVEGGSVNLTKEDKDQYYINLMRKWKERGMIGKRAEA